MKRGEIIYKILDTLENKAIETADFFESVLTAGYGASLSKIDYEIEKRTDRHLAYKLQREKKRRLQKYLFKLKADGLINENKKEISLSVLGRKKLALIKNKSLVNKKNFKKELGEKVIIISYDLPVAFNRERDRLREILSILGFKLVHKSVWVGKVKLPKEFVLALGKMGIVDFVEVMEVTKSGSLKSYNL